MAETPQESRDLGLRLFDRTITDECLTNRGRDGAIVEALRQTTEVVKAQIERGRTVTIAVEVQIDRDEADHA